MENVRQWGKKVFLLSLLSLISLAGFAQSIVKGSVKDANGEPVIGANVIVTGTRNQTTSDLDGNFSISCPSNGRLTVSYIGLVSQTVNVSGRSYVDVTLEEDNRTLDGVVVIGYGVQKKSDLTGAIASVSGDDIKNLSTPDAGAALQGKVTGVQVINSGAPGAGAEIRVRGYGSLSNNSPLYVVDGVKMSSIQYLDPSLIKSIEVLKDAASAAIYGAAAGNGVVIITTKSGANAGGMSRITYELKAASQSLGKKADLFNAADYIEYHKYLGDLTQEELDRNHYKGTDTDWYDEVFDKSWRVQHTLTAQGGNSKGHYLVSLGLVNDDGIVKGDKDTYKRFTAQLNADYKFNDWLQVTSNTSVEKWKRTAVGNGYASFLNSVVSIDPLTPAYVYSQDDMGMNMKDRWALENHGNVMTAPGYTDENPIWYGTSKYIEDATGNPLAMRDRVNGTSGGINIRGALAANITPVKWLTYTSRLGYTISQGNGHDFGLPWWLSSMAHGENYTLNANTDAGLDYTWENFVNFDKSFGKHNVSAMAGMSFRKVHTDNTSASVSDTKPVLEGNSAPNYRYMNFLNSNGKEKVRVSNAPGDNTELAYFGRLAYNYDSRYFVQFNIRRDAFDTSRLSTSKRWGTFKSFSAGWTLSNEEFFKNMVSADKVSFLKIRGSWGQNGSLGGLYDQAYKWDKTVAIGGYYNFSNTPTTAAAPTGIANPDLQWETSEQTDLGIDARFLNDRLTFGFDWYNKITKNWLLQVNPLAPIGVSSATVNAGDVKNTGIEIELGWQDHIGDLKYSVNTNFTTLKNEVQSINETTKRMSYTGISGFNNKLQPTVEVGHTMYYFRGWKYAGVDPKTGVAQYYDKEGKITTSPGEDDKYDLGSGIPTFTYGITINLEYKGFDFTVFGTGAAGNKIYNLMVSADRPRINGINTYWKDSWKQEDDNTKYPDMKKVANDWTFFSSDAAVFNGSFFKFKQIQLGYTIPASITKKALISDLRLSVSLDDFFTITSYPGADPETSSLNSGQSRGFDNGNYPTSKKVVFGLSLSF